MFNINYLWPQKKIKKLKEPIFYKFIYLLGFIFFFTSSSAQDSIVCNEKIRRGVDGMKNLKYAYAIENLTSAKAIAEKEKLPNQLFLSSNNLGLTHYKMMDYGNALIHLLDAYETAIINKSPVNEMTVLNNIAIVYIKDGKKDKAEEYFIKSFETAKRNNITTRIGLYATNLAQLKLDAKEYAEAQKYITIAIPELKNEPQVLLNARTIENYLKLEKGKISEVITSSILLLKEASTKDYHEEKSELHYLLSKAFYIGKLWNKSMIYIENGIKGTDNKETKIRFYELKSQVALSLNQPDKAIASKDSIIVLTKIINESNNKELLENTSLRFELSKSQNELNFSKTNTANHKRMYLLFIVILLLSLLSLFGFYFKRNQLLNQKKIISDNLLKIKNLQLDQEKKNSQLLKSELEQKELLALLESEKQKENEILLKKEIEDKNKLLSDKILFQSTRNELIEEVIEKITTDTKIEVTDNLLKTVRDLKSHLKEDSKWDDFMSHFENVNNDFIVALKNKHDWLNANDIRFLSFIYLNLNTKEIASLLNISPVSCRKRKERLIKKLQLNQNVTLFSYLSQIK